MNAEYHFSFAEPLKLAINELNKIILLLAAILFFSLQTFSLNQHRRVLKPSFVILTKGRIIVSILGNVRLVHSKTLFFQCFSFTGKLGETYLLHLKLLNAEKNTFESLILVYRL